VVSPLSEDHPPPPPAQAPQDSFIETLLRDTEATQRLVLASMQQLPPLTPSPPVPNTASAVQATPSGRCYLCGQPLISEMAFICRKTGCGGAYHPDCLNEKRAALWADRPSIARSTDELSGAMNAYTYMLPAFACRACGSPFYST